MRPDSEHPATYVCPSCDATFTWHDEEAAVAELAPRWPDVAPRECLMVCDDCYARFQPS